MSNQNPLLPVVAILLGVAALGFSLFGGGQKLGGSIETLKVSFGDGWEVVSEMGTVVASLTKAGVLTITGASSFATTTTNGLFTKSPAVLATTTAGTGATISQADLLSTQYWTVNLGAANDFTYTLPASSTLTTLLPNTGESADWCFDNATTTANIDLVFVAGTGIDLEMATTTSVLEYVGAADSACITLQRKANTDLFARLTIFDDSD